MKIGILTKAQISDVRLYRKSSADKRPIQIPEEAGKLPVHTLEKKYSHHLQMTDNMAAAT